MAASLEWTFCTVHTIGCPEGVCSLCNGDRNLLQVVPRATRDALNEELIEARAEASMWHIKYDASEEERAAWKAKTRESVRDFLTEHPDLRIRQLSDMTGVLEAELDLLSTKLARAMEALEWYADPENNGRQTLHNGEQSEATSSWPVYRPIDDDEGNVARGALEAIGEIK